MLSMTSAWTQWARACTTLGRPIPLEHRLLVEAMLNEGLLTALQVPSADADDLRRAAEIIRQWVADAA
jgi:hypothetical protein